LEGFHATYSRPSARVCCSRVVVTLRSISFCRLQRTASTLRPTGQSWFGEPCSANTSPQETERYMSTSLIEAAGIASLVPPDAPVCDVTRPALLSWLKRRRMTTGFVLTLLAM